jgi:hypothetical protein
MAGFAEVMRSKKTRAGGKPAFPTQKIKSGGKPAFPTPRLQSGSLVADGEPFNLAFMFNCN